jgi:hypothetical protein
MKVRRTAWDAAWEQSFARLAAYKSKHGDCGTHRRLGKKLGNWARNQRKNKGWLDRGKPNLRLTAAQVARLEALGFAWDTTTCDLHNLPAAGRERARGPRAGEAAAEPSDGEDCPEGNELARRIWAAEKDLEGVADGWCSICQRSGPPRGG